MLIHLDSAPTRSMIPATPAAAVAELADALDSGSSVERRAGSTPVGRNQIPLSSLKNSSSARLRYAPCVLSFIARKEAKPWPFLVKRSTTSRSEERRVGKECST